jgi:putative hemolysin
MLLEKTFAGISLLILAIVLLALMPVKNLAGIFAGTMAEINSAQLISEELSLITETNLDSEIKYSHAEFVHLKGDIDLVRKLCPKNGGIMKFKNPSEGTVLEFCKLPDGRIGFRFWKFINNSWKETTAFVKDNFNCVTDVLKWASKNGFFKWTGLMK